MKRGICIWILNSLALEAVQMRLKNGFHGNPKAQACTRCPVACQQHSCSLEDIFLVGVDLPEVYYTFSRVEHGFISVPMEGLLWIIFLNFSIIPKLSIDGIILIAFQGEPPVFMQLFSPKKFLFLSCFLQGKMPI